MSLIGPIDLRHGAGPWLGYKDIAEPLSKASIERCIMGNDQSCTISKRRHLLGIDLSARDHLVGDAGNHGDRGRDRRGGFLKALIGVVDFKNAAVETVREGNHRQFDHLVLLVVEAEIGKAASRERGCKTV